MSKFKVSVGSAAVREIKKLDRKAQLRIIECLENLADDPRPKGVEKLQQNPRFWRVRTGEYRIVYNIDDASVIIYVVVVRHRKDAYRGLADLDSKLVAATLSAQLSGGL